MPNKLIEMGPKKKTHFKLSPSLEPGAEQDLAVSWPWTAAQRQDWFAFRDRNKRWYSFTGAFMTVNATAQQRKSLLDKNKRQLTKVTSSLSLLLYRLTTGANVSSLPSMCREFISQNQQLVQPCSLGTSKLYSWLPDFQGQCFWCLRRRGPA